MINTLCEGVKSAHAWKSEEKNSMRRLFEHGLRVWPNLVHCLREAQGQLVHYAQERGYDWRSLAEFDLELVQLADEGRLDDALLRVAEKLQREVETLWPDCPLASYRLLLTQLSERQSGSSIPASACHQ